MATTYLTQEALTRLRDELKNLKTKGRARIAASIGEARAQGDLSENAEYDAAKEEQGHLENRIAQLEETILSSRVVDEKNIDPTKAYILSKVKVKNHKMKTDQTFQLVSQEEADTKTGKISISSPIGKALLGKEVGDVIEVKVPAGKIKLEVLHLSR